MSNYYTNERAKVELSSVLKENGWEIFGYKNDESDSMSDYFSPASWEGVATKNGYVLLVDQYSTRYSGYEVKKYDYSKTRSNSDKVSKLQATVNDKAATEAEKETALKLIEKLNSKGTTPEYEVLATYPTFEHKTPKACIWHIEKDGAIIAKGKGLYSLYETNDRNLTKSNMQAFTQKLENHINDNSELVPVQKEVKTMTTEVVAVGNKELAKNVTMIKLNSNFTGGFRKGTVLAYTEDFGSSRIFVKLGKKLQKLKATHSNSITLNAEKLEKWIVDGSISVVELKEVETVTFKTVYVKQKCKQKAASTDVQIETTVVNEEVAPETVEAVQTEVVESVQSEITFKLNEEKSGVEIYFTDKPSEEVRDNLKANGFRWSKFNKCWYAKQSENTVTYAESLTGGNVSDVTNETVEPFEIEVPEFVDVTQFNISEETEQRLINNSLFGDMRTVGRETNELQSTLSSLLEETKAVIELTDNNYTKNKLIEGFNGFCERYTRELSSYLYQRSINPSWATTGRGGINISRYNKKQDQLHNKMMKVVEMLDTQREILNKYENRIRREKEFKIKQDIQKTIKKLEGAALSFTTKNREITYHGYKMHTRSYESPNYFMMKVGGCYRIFELTTGKEVHAMRTVDKLDDGKNHVLYLEHMRSSEAV